MNTLKLLKRLKKHLKGKDVELPSPETIAVLIADFVWLKGSFECSQEFVGYFFPVNLNPEYIIADKKNAKKIINSAIFLEKYDIKPITFDFKDLAKAIHTISFTLFDKSFRERFYNEMRKQF